MLCQARCRFGRSSRKSLEPFSFRGGRIAFVDRSQRQRRRTRSIAHCAAFLNALWFLESPDKENEESETVEACSLAAPSFA